MGVRERALGIAQGVPLGAGALTVVQAREFLAWLRWEAQASIERLEKERGAP